MSTLSYALVMELWVQLTIWYRLNCAQNSSAKAHVPSKIAGGMPLMPCYVRAERSARLEQEGYDRVASLVVNEAFASGTR